MDNDILFEDENISMLTPNSSRGILVISKIENEVICTQGMYSAAWLQKNLPEFSKIRSISHDVIFFRAPFYNKNNNQTLEDSYGDDFYNLYKNVAIIRVDPNKTFVFSSECRANFIDSEQKKNNCLGESRKLLTEYLNIIKQNESINCIQPLIPNWHLTNYEKSCRPTQRNERYRGIGSRGHNSRLLTVPVERNSEILVKRDHIPIEWFYSIYYDGKQCYPKKSDTNEEIANVNMELKANINMEQPINVYLPEVAKLEQPVLGEQSGGKNNTYYLKKYRKYKQKYINLKNMNK